VASLAVSLSAGTSLRRLSVLRDCLAVARGRPGLVPPRPAAGPPSCSPLSAGHPAHWIGKEVPVRTALTGTDRRCPARRADHGPRRGRRAAGVALPMRP